jgi:prophage regulatory protein
MRKPNDRLISTRAVCALTSLSRSTLWRLSQAGKFPTPVRLTTGRVGYSEAAVREWIETRLDNRSDA